MPVDWPYASDLLDLRSRGRVQPEDAARQETTAQEILADLAERPGVILADEVGMGKTYVALAVAASILQATRDRQGPVVVMVPPNLRHKWSREWEQFKAVCVQEGRAGDLAWIRHATVRNATEFFRAIDGHGQPAANLVFMPSTAFTQALNDPWVRLVMIRLARSRTRLDENSRRALQRWAARLVQLHSKLRTIRMRSRSCCPAVRRAGTRTSSESACWPRETRTPFRTTFSRSLISSTGRS